MYDKEVFPDYHPVRHLTRDPEFSYSLACQLPHFLKERKIELGETDKVFAAEWISEDEVVVGTKCNKIFVVDVTNGSVSEIPTLRTINTQRSDDICGIHSIAVSPERQLVATGGCNPNELGIYRLPEWEPLAVGEGHMDWLFDTRWISNNVVVSGSRDSTMAAWDVSSCRLESKPYQLAEEAQSIEPVLRFRNVQAQNHGTEGEKVRSLAFDPHGCMLGSLQTNPFSATVYFWDIYTFQQVGRTEMPYCVENVCMEADNMWNIHLYAVGSRSHVTLIDGRQPCRAASSFQSLDRDCGVRSLQFNSNVLSMGTGAGHLYFYDLRAGRYLDTEACSHGASSSRVCALKTSQGWLRHDAVYRDFFTGYPEPPNALYTHCYSPARSKIFVAGGPLPLGLYGNYAGIWQ